MAPLPHTPTDPPQVLSVGHGHRSSPRLQNTWRLDGQTPILTPASLQGRRAVSTHEHNEKNYWSNTKHELLSKTQFSKHRGRFKTFPKCLHIPYIQTPPDRENKRWVWPGSVILSSSYLCLSEPRYPIIWEQILHWACHTKSGFCAHS